MDAVVFPLLWRGHDLQPNVVVDGGGRDKALLAAHRRGNEAEILLQQYDDLVHIQAEIRYRLPVRQMIIRDELAPPLQLVGDQFLVIFHSDTPVSDLLYSIPHTGTSCKKSSRKIC